MADESSDSVLILVRHGDRFDYANPEWKPAARALGNNTSDPPLSALGHAQALETAAAIASLTAARGWAVADVLASPYLRVIQTATPTADALGLPIKLEDGIAETHHGLRASMPPAAERFAYFPRVDPRYGDVPPLLPTTTTTTDDDGGPAMGAREVLPAGRGSAVAAAAVAAVVAEAEAEAAAAAAEGEAATAAAAASAVPPLLACEATPGHAHRVTGGPAESYPEGYMARMVRMASVLEAAYDGRCVVCFSHAASVALVAALLRTSIASVGKFAACGVFVLRKPAGAASAWVLEQRAETNPHVTANAPTTFPWTFPEEQQKLWRWAGADTVGGGAAADGGQ